MKIDRLVALFFLLLSAGLFIYTFSLPPKSQGYPQFIISILALLSLALLVQSLRKTSTTSWKDLFAELEYKRFLIVVSSCLIYIILISMIGFLTTTALYLILTMYLLRLNLKTLAISTTCFMVLIYVVFKVLLKVPLPTGLLI